MFKFFCIGLLSIVLISCGSTANYVGKSYPATTDVEIFMDWRDIAPKYEIMGYVDATPGVWDTGVESAQKRIEQLAREKGADAIVIEGVDSKIVTNPTVVTTEEKKKNDSGGYTKTATTTANDGRVSVLKATFIKYK